MSKSYPNQLADIFADERINPVLLGQETSRMFTPSMSHRLNEFIKWHNKRQGLISDGENGNSDDQFRHED